MGVLLVILALVWLLATAVTFTWPSVFATALLLWIAYLIGRPVLAWWRDS